MYLSRMNVFARGECLQFSSPDPWFGQQCKQSLWHRKHRRHCAGGSAIGDASRLRFSLRRWGIPAIGEDVKDTNEGSENRAAGEYDPFVRGRFPVGVRTFEALDTARNRLFPCEIWYPAAARHAGQDLAPETQDVFTVPLRDESRSQLAVRNAAAEPGTWPQSFSRILVAGIGGAPRSFVRTCAATAM